MVETMNPLVEYRDMPGYVGYKIGADGSVWSCLKRGSWRTTVIKATWHRRKTVTHKTTGYVLVTLSRDGVNKTFTLHSLVLTAFVGPCPEGHEARHFPDPTRTNCAASNLLWGTKLENCNDRSKDGNTVRGSKSFHSRLTETQVQEIRASHGTLSLADASEKYGVSKVTINAVRQRDSWRHIA